MSETGNINIEKNVPSPKKWKAEIFSLDFANSQAQ
jgi:hypothetical protein